MEFVCHFFKALLKNKRIDLGVEILPIFHDITSKIAAMYYLVTNSRLKDNAMSVLQLINNSLAYSLLLENVQHPAN